MSDYARSHAVGPDRLKRRAEFLAAAKGARFRARPFSLQALAADEGGAARPPRFGFTVTKKVGGSVERNRIRRRLREAVRLLPENSARLGHDYVIVARREALAAPFLSLQNELRRALVGVHLALDRSEPAQSYHPPRNPSALSAASGKAPLDTDQASKDERRQ